MDEAPEIEVREVIVPSHRTYIAFPPEFYGRHSHYLLRTVCKNSSYL